MTGDDWQIVLFTVKVAALSTLLILPPGLALAWVLARGNWRGKALVETVAMLPLFVPPVATGLLLLLLFSRNGLLDGALGGAGIVFTWRAVVIACAVMSFPLLVRTAQSAFAEVNPRLEEIARTLGASEWRVFRTISLPLARRGVVAGAVLAFARGMGEFGATAMVAGMIPHQTMTISLAIYQDVQLNHDAAALPLLFVSVLIIFAAVLCGQVVSSRPLGR